MSLEGIDNIERSDGLALGMLSVCDSITNDTLKEGLENTTGLLVDHFEISALDANRGDGVHTRRDTLDTTTTSETTDSGLSDTLNVVTKNLSVTLGSTLSKALATFAA